MTKKENLQRVEANIELACKSSGRNRTDIQLVAVTKTISAEQMTELYTLGLRHFGENRADVFLEKTKQLKQPDIKWHYIGSLQTRKVRDVISKIDYLHSLDRPSLAKEIEKRAIRKVKCFLQLNISGEEAKHGFTKEEAIQFLQETSFQKIEVVGLMTMAPLTEDEIVLHDVFHRLKVMQEEIAQLNIPHVPCSEISMGMTNDYEVAISEGATYIRVGRALVNN